IPPLFHVLAARWGKVVGAACMRLLRHCAGHLRFEPPDYCDAGVEHGTNCSYGMKGSKPCQGPGIAQYQKRDLIADGAAHCKPRQEAAEHADFPAALLSG